MAESIMDDVAGPHGATVAAAAVFALGASTTLLLRTTKMPEPLVLVCSGLIGIATRAFGAH